MEQFVSGLNDFEIRTYAQYSVSVQHRFEILQRIERRNVMSRATL